MNLGQPLAILALSFATSAFGQAAFSVENKKPEKPIVGQPFSADQVIRTGSRAASGQAHLHPWRAPQTSNLDQLVNRLVTQASLQR